MRILAVLGSPHKGQGYDIVRQIETEMKKFEDIEFECLFLKDMKLEYCRGCFACFAKGETYCPMEDDFSKILEKIENSDGVIFSSPVYFFNVSAIMKNFMDRFAYLTHRPCFFNKPALIVANSATPSGIKETLYSLSIFGGAGFNIVHKLGIVKHPYLKPKSKFQKNMGEKIKAAAKKLLVSVKSGRKDYVPSWGPMSFAALKTNASLAKEYFTADYEYYKEKDYYFKVKIGFVKNVLSNLVAMMVRKTMKKDYEC